MTVQLFKLLSLDSLLHCRPCTAAAVFHCSLWVRGYTAAPPSRDHNDGRRNDQWNLRGKVNVPDQQFG